MAQKLLSSKDKNMLADLIKKQLEERKLVEESDNQLIRQLFDVEEVNEIRKIEESKKIVKSILNNTKVSKQKVNVTMQRELSINNKKSILQRKKLAETFGEAKNKDNEYEDLEDKFYT